MYKPPAATNGNNVARAICWWWDAWLPSSTMMSKAVATERARSSPRVAGYSDLGLILCRFWIEAQRGLVFVIELFSHRSHLPRSNSVTLTARQRSAARMSAPNISFRTARSPKALGMILRRRRLVAVQELVLDKFGGS